MHGTAEALSTGMAHLGWVVRNYVPVGDLLEGMAYLVRRILENASQVGVLAQGRMQVRGARSEVRGSNIEHRTSNPEQYPPSITALGPAFVNIPPLRPYIPEEWEPAWRAVADFTADSAREVPTGFHGARLQTYSPSDPSRGLGQVPLATPHDAEAAVARAARGYECLPWATWPASERAAVLLRAAIRLTVHRPRLAALIVHEGGKILTEALADVDEAIDFCHYYAKETVRIAREQPYLAARGVFAVIAPWNFPCSIPCGMAVGALAAGNTVLLKPAEHTPLVAHELVRTLHAAGVPADALVYCAGPGAEIGPILTEHPAIAGVAFTGSKAVGMRIARHAGRRLVALSNGHLVPARVIAEMGGKNAIVVTATADLDQAVAGILISAFGHAGQKCSAASRVVVDRRVLPRFAKRLVAALRDYPVGRADDPAACIPPLIGPRERTQLRAHARAAMDEAVASGGRVLCDRTHEPLPGYCLGPCVVELSARRACARESLAQQELFGPILHVIAYATEAEAIALFNGTEYGLTGGIYSQSEDEIARLLPFLEAGNIYVNRPCTGAHVAIEPFGGFKHSGTGPKAGGPWYVEAFYRMAASDLPHAAPPFDRLLDACAQALPALIARYRANRAIPGQISRNDFGLIKRRAIYVAHAWPPAPSLLGYLAAAVTLGAAVTILCATDDVAAGVAAHDISHHVTSQCMPWTDIAKALQAKDLDVVLVDGSPEAIARTLAASRKDDVTPRHMRTILTPLDAPPYRPEKYLEPFFRIRSHAVNTIRHGADFAPDEPVR
ncbi:MAG: proline dehydrogenase family protein [Deltaproteobacteria bacterium]|nr:proline dehydrogenase family protein [Deltaproteobacteria bacterium]